MPSNASLATRNHLLNNLKPESFERLRPYIKEFDAYLGRTLYSPFEPIEHVYFPNNSMASIVASTESGHTTEIGVIGCEGAAGLEIVMGRTSSPNESMIQIADSGHRIPSRYLLAEFERSADTRLLFLSFIKKFIIQISQTTLCNRLHNVEQRLARWLLLCYDRVDKEHLKLTQQYLSVMLGVTRVSVTHAANGFQDLGLIKYKRGKVTIADYEGLQKSVCECYAIVKAEYDATECNAN